MNRKNFLKATLVGAAAVALPSTKLFGVPAPQNNKKNSPKLKLSFQEGIAPGETLTERLDFMEKLGVVGLEPWGNGLSGRVNEIQQELRGRNIKVSAICAGFNGFILAEDPNVRAECINSMQDILAAAGELGSVGVVFVPGFNGQQPALAHTLETRKFLVEQMQELAAFAAKHNTSVILEPLNRGEAFYLRQVADAASLCRDINSPGIGCLGDFWHMTIEETSDWGAFLSGGEYLKHVHIASRGTRNTPGEDGDVDNYIDGFKGLKQIGYDGYVSYECGTKGDKKIAIPASVKLLNDQWEKA